MSIQPDRWAWTESVTAVLETALGRAHRDDPALPRSGGPAGNARMTAWVGLLLLGLFLVECATLLSLRELLSVHIVVGTVLVPLVLLKTATTGWRMLRYYTGHRPYRHAGPPPLLLRLLGPLVVLTGLAVLGSGLALIPLGTATYDPLLSVAGQQIDALTVHKLAFVAWFMVVGAHTLTRLVPAVVLTAGRTSGTAVAGARTRAVVITVGLVVGFVAGFAVLHESTAWTGNRVARHVFPTDTGPNDQ